VKAIIVDTLQIVHKQTGIIHRDLRKYNLLRDDAGNIIISDWGFSVKNKEKANFAGALECAGDDLLNNIMNGQKLICYKPHMDLLCFVRTIYLMIHQPKIDRLPFSVDKDIEIEAYKIHEFWSQNGTSDFWENIKEHAMNLRYSELQLELERLF